MIIKISSFKDNHEVSELLTYKQTETKVESNHN